MGIKTPERTIIMANIFKIETRAERINRMQISNPGRPIELCEAVVDGMWEKKREYLNSFVPERFASASIEDMGYLGEEVVKAVEFMLESPSKSNDVVGIILAGKAGTGKTHTLYSVLKMIIERNPEMIVTPGVMTYAKIMQALKHEFANDAYDEFGSVWDKVNNHSGMYGGILFIDDLSASKLTDFEVDKLTMMLDERMNNYMPFIITTNVPVEKFIEVFGERLASRLLGYCKIILFEDKDVRLEKNEI